MLLWKLKLILFTWTTNEHTISLMLFMQNGKINISFWLKLMFIFMECFEIEKVFNLQEASPYSWIIHLKCWKCDKIFIQSWQSWHACMHDFLKQTLNDNVILGHNLLQHFHQYSYICWNTENTYQRYS